MADFGNAYLLLLSHKYFRWQNYKSQNFVKLKTCEIEFHEIFCITITYYYYISGGKTKSLKIEPCSPSLIVKPQDISECETFEGRAFLKWVTHTLANDDYLKMQLTEQDLKFIGRQFGSLLLNAKLVNEMNDKNNSTTNLIGSNVEDQNTVLFRV